MPPAVVAARLRAAKTHLDFVVGLYWGQLARGCHFLHEHPATAESWEDEAMRALIEDTRVSTIVGHMCRQGMKQADTDGIVRPVLKPTRWASSVAKVL